MAQKPLNRRSPPPKRQQPARSRRDATDRGAFRDKVAAPDPAAASMDADSEASGSSSPIATADPTERAQETAAIARVPKQDPEISISTADHPDRATMAGWRPLSLALIGIVVLALLVWGLLSLP